VDATRQPSLAALAEWGVNLLGQPRDDDATRSSWLVLGLTVTAEPDPSIPDATYELRIDDETFHIRTHQGHLHPAHGPAPTADATITMTKRTLAAIAGGVLDPASRRDGGLIDVGGDSAGARGLLESLRRSV
jgi:hypothetical protein